MQIIEQDTAPPPGFVFPEGVSVDWSRLIGEEVPEPSYFFEICFKTPTGRMYGVEHLTDPNDLKSQEIWTRVTALRR